jgi:hypothetical protein
LSKRWQKAGASFKDFRIETKILAENSGLEFLVLLFQDKRTANQLFICYSLNEQEVNKI